MKDNTEKKYIINVQEDSGRIDVLLAHVPELEEIALSRNAAMQLVESGKVSVNGKTVAKNYKVRKNDTIEVSILPPKPMQTLAQDIPLEVVYEDEDLIVINKPRGMVVHPAVGHTDSTMVNALLSHCGDSLSGIGGVMRPGIVHRLDKDTSGLIIAAKNDFTHEALSAQLKDRSLSRIYDCVVQGTFKQDSGTVDAPIGRNPKDRKKMAVTNQNSREAVTHWKVVKRYRGYTWLQCKLQTGRTHQIRVHMAYIGHPLLGDTIYGGKKDKGMETQCLNASYLQFVHPRTKKKVELQTELPDWFLEVLKKLPGEEL